MEKEIKFIYSIFGTLFCFFFIAFGWVTFIIIMMISAKQGFTSRDFIGGGVLLLMYLGLNAIFILGVLKYTMTKIKLNTDGITVKKPFNKEIYLAWTNIGLISEGLVPSYLYGSTKGYIIKVKMDDSKKDVYLIKSKKVTVFLDKIMGKYGNT